MKKAFPTLLILLFSFCGLVGCALGHEFNKQVVSEQYLASEATCDNKASYYYSCECGKKGTKTFEFGESLGHSYGEWVSNGNGTHTKTCTNDNTHTITEDCLGGTATCVSLAVCSECDSEYGQLKNHAFFEKVIEDKYKVSSATCNEKGVYNFSCICGKKGKATFKFYVDCEFTNGYCKWCLGSQGLSYTLTNKDTEYEVKVGACNQSKITIPKTYKGKPVTSIGYEAFNKCTSLESIVIPDGVRKINESAFKNCSSLSSIDMPDSVTSIDYAAFSGCNSLTNIVISNNVTKIAGYAFNGCTLLTSVTIPNKVTNIAICSFSECSSLTSIVIPEGVTSIGSYAFSYCSNLTIYCEVDAKPSGWHDDWNPDNLPVVWGYKE